MGVRRRVLKVIICGSHQWAFAMTIEQTIMELQRESKRAGRKLLIIHGNEPGAETMAHGVCRNFSIDVIIHEAVRTRGQSSYYRRNELMLNYHRPDLVIGFAPVIKESSVVSDMLKRARKKGIAVRAVDRKSLYSRNRQASRARSHTISNDRTR